MHAWAAPGDSIQKLLQLSDHAAQTSRQQDLKSIIILGCFCSVDFLYNRHPSAMPRRSKTVECLITMPNSVVHRVSIPEDGTGQQCLEKVRWNILQNSVVNINSLEYTFTLIVCTSIDN